MLTTHIIPQIPLKINLNSGGVLIVGPFHIDLLSFF